VAMDCNPGQVFPIPGFGIQDVVIPGSRRDYVISLKYGIYRYTSGAIALCVRYCKLCSL